VRRIVTIFGIILILEAVFLISYYRFLKKRKVQSRFWFLPPIVLAVLAYLAHQFAHRFYLPSRFCPYFWLGDLLILILTTIFYLRSRSRSLA